MTTLLLITYAIFALIILIYVTTVFVLAQALGDNSIMDIFYGPAFAVGAWGTMFVTDTFAPTTVVIAALVTLWAARLAVRIGIKNWGAPEDARYRAWRTTWQERGMLYFVLRSYIQVYLLQGIIITIVALPAIVAVATPDPSFSLISYIGIGIFVLGLCIESLADLQLDRFLTKKRAGKTHATIMTEGLFRYSRRPNYFGETLVWLGLAVAVLPFAYGSVALVSPILIAFIVTRVTGPMLERAFAERYPEEYHAYTARTSYFIPMPPKAHADHSPE